MAANLGILLRRPQNYIGKIVQVSRSYSKQPFNKSIIQDSADIKINKFID